jgi:hypothetical protein
VSQAGGVSARPAAALLALAGAVLAACAALPVPTFGPVPGQSTPQTEAPALAEELLVLVGRVGSMRLAMADPAIAGHGLAFVDTRGLPPNAAWLSAAGTSRVVTTLAGELLVSSGADTWEPAPRDLGEALAARAFGTLDPAAGQVAVTVGGSGSGQPGRLVVTSPAGEPVASIRLEQAAESAPAWLPDGRIAVVVRDARDRPLAMVADPAKGTLTAGPAGPLRSVATGGGVVALVDERGQVRTEAVTDWLAGQPGEYIAAVSEGDVLQSQPSSDGTELAEVIANLAGDAQQIAVLGLPGGHEIARFVLPDGANRAVVSWLAAP